MSTCKCGAAMEAGAAFCSACGFAKAALPADGEDFAKSYSAGLDALEAFVKAGKAPPPPMEGDGDADDADDVPPPKRRGKRGAPPAGDEAFKSWLTQGGAALADGVDAGAAGQGDGGGAEIVPVDVTPLLSMFHKSVAVASAKDDLLLKGMTAIAAQTLAQGRLLQGLAEKVNTMGSAGTGRKSILSVFEKSAGGEAAAAASADKGPWGGLTREDVFAKCDVLSRTGKASPDEIAQIGIYTRGGQPMPAHLLRLVAGDTK